MDNGEWKISLDDADKIHARLQRLLTNLKPHSEDDVDYYFFEVIRELVIATSANYSQLRNAYVSIDNTLLAWACRGLLELRVFVKYALTAGANCSHTQIPRRVAVRQGICCHIE
jgi:hypothetical protein